MFSTIDQKLSVCNNDLNKMKNAKPSENNLWKSSLSSATSNREKYCQWKNSVQLDA